MTRRTLAVGIAMALLGTMGAGCTGRQGVENAETAATRAEDAARSGDAAAARCTTAAASCGVAQTRLCGPCTQEAGCRVPGWPEALCRNGKCYALCPGTQRFACWINASGQRRAGCRPAANVNCRHPDRCP